MLLLLRRGEPASSLEAAPTYTTETVPVLRRPRVTRGDPNALTLDTARYRVEPGEWCGPLPVLTIGEILTEQGYRGPLSLQFTFEVEAVPSKVHVVIEDAEEYQVTVNGRPVRCEGLPYWIDRSFHPIDITALVQTGENVVELRRAFVPLPQARFSLSRLFETLEGVELEAIYLTGDFAVRGVPSRGAQMPRCVRLGSKFAIARECGSTTGDLVSEGYPFYAGHVTLSEVARLRAPRPGERVMLSLPTIDGAALAHVEVNGERAGTIAWAPYDLEITELVREGENEIAVTLVSTLRNLLGPHHRPEGEPDECWGTDFTLSPEWSEDQAEREARWTDDYFFLRFGVPDGAYIAYVAHDRGEGS